MRIFLEYLKVGLWMLPIILPALWLLPRLSKRHAARVSYVIWLVLAVRLLIPWNLTLPQETAPIHVAIAEEQANEWVQAKFNPVQAPPKAEGTAAAAQKQTQPQAEPLQPLQIGFALWLAGVLFFALRTAISVFRMKSLLRRWEKEPSAETKAFFAETAGKTQPRLMVCPVLDVLNEPRLNHQVAVEEGVLQPQCSEIMKRFFKRFRKNANAAPLTENQ